MNKQLNPKDLGLHSSTIVEQLSENELAIIVRRKSRVIMKDGHKLMEKVNKIQSTYPRSRVKILTTAPVCGKTRAFLLEQDVVVESIEEV